MLKCGLIKIAALWVHQSRELCCSRVARFYVTVSAYSTLGLSLFRISKSNLVFFLVFLHHRRWRSPARQHYTFDIIWAVDVAYLIYQLLYFLQFSLRYGRLLAKDL